MAISAASLPESALRLLSPADRKSLGVQSAGDARAKFEAREEKVLQGEVSKFLSFQRAQGRCQFIIPPMHEKSRLPEGWPDLTLFISNGKAVLIEFKAPGGATRPTQTTMHASLLSLGHPVRIVRSVAEFIAIWKAECAAIS